MNTSQKYIEESVVALFTCIQEMFAYLFLETGYEYKELHYEQLPNYQTKEYCRCPYKIESLRKMHGGNVFHDNTKSRKMRSNTKLVRTAAAKTIQRFVRSRKIGILDWDLI